MLLPNFLVKAMPKEFTNGFDWMNNAKYEGSDFTVDGEIYHNGLYHPFKDFKVALFTE
jgi:hypothetical protein